MTIMRVYADIDDPLLQEIIQNTQDVANAVPFDPDELVQNILEEIFGSVAFTENIPEYIEKKIINFFLDNIYPEIRAYESAPPNLGAGLGSEENALGSYRLPPEIHSRVSEALEDYVYELAKKYS